MSITNFPKSATPIVERRFSQLNPPSGQEPQPAKTLAAFFDMDGIVVLGDPGSGKTTSFREASQTEPKALFTTVRDFLALNLNRFRGYTLYLDALDEMRGRTEDGYTVLDRVRSRLDGLGCPRFRLSCRAADWYGSSDTIRLAEVSPSKIVTVLEIEPLGENQIIQIISSRGIEPRGFVAEAETRGIYKLLENPQTLLMLIEVVGQGRWPETRAQLFTQTVEILIQEVNEEHRRTPRANVATQELLKAAGYLSAVILCGGAEGIALDEGAAGDDFLPIRAIGRTTDHFLETTRRRLFRNQGPERVVPIHRTVAEYLAARYLCDRIHEGLPVRRVLSLITGHDGGTLSDLRGIFAWLTCICLDHADILIPVDPLGVVLYGDVALLPSSTKKRVIDNLVALAQENPWFRSENWTSAPFGALASPDMEPVFRQILMDRDQNPVALSCVIDAIRHGHPMPSLGDLLLAIIRDESRAEFLRNDALMAFLNICSGRENDLRILLDDIHEGRVRDRHCRLRGLLLRHLYPGILGPTEVVRYLIDEPEGYIGEYTMWVGHGLVPATNPADIPQLLDAVVTCAIDPDPIRRFSWRRFVGHLLQEGLSRYGEVVPVPQLYRWLGAALDRDDTCLLEGEQEQAIRNWLEAHPDRIFDMLADWITQTPAIDLERQSYRFHERIFRVDWPTGFGQRFLGLAATQGNYEIAVFLFREAVRLRTWRDRADAPALEELIHFVEEHPCFQAALDPELYYLIPNWRIESMQRRENHRREREAAQEARVRWLVGNLPQIRSGTHIAGLNMLAKAYFGLFIEVDRNSDPRGRIASITNDECAEAALEGFIAALYQQHPEAPTPAMIGEVHARSREYPFGFVILAGMDLLSQQSMDKVKTLPDSVLGSALAYHYAIGMEHNRAWVRFILRENPELASEVMEDFWRAHLVCDCKHIPGFYSLSRDEMMGDLARKKAMSLLRDFPNCKELEDLLRAGLVYADWSEMQTLAVDVLSRSNAVRGNQRILWCGVAFLSNPTEFGPRLKAYVGRDPVKAGHLVSFLSPPWPENRKLRSPELSPLAIGELISICGTIFIPCDRDEEEHEARGPDHIQSVKGLIDRLASDSREEAARILKTLITLRALKPWRETLVHALAIQTRRRREAAFRYPSASQVIDTLNGSSPANSADLQALVFEHLLALRDDISRGPTDGYKAFWNVGPRGSLLSPRPEDECRDRLLDHLRYRLAPLGLAVEPEGQYAMDKRSDIKVLYRNTLNLPIEIKRHYRRNVWTAPQEQLKKFYAEDPGAGGRGIYFVIWFGTAGSRRVPRPPNDLQRPGTASEMENALYGSLPERDRIMIDIMVLDCSPRTAAYSTPSGHPIHEDAAT